METSFCMLNSLVLDWIRARLPLTRNWMVFGVDLNNDGMKNFKTSKFIATTDWTTSERKKRLYYGLDSLWLRNRRKSLSICYRLFFHSGTLLLFTNWASHNLSGMLNSVDLVVCHKDKFKLPETIKKAMRFISFSFFYVSAQQMIACEVNCPTKTNESNWIQ